MRAVGLLLGVLFVGGGLLAVATQDNSTVSLLLFGVAIVAVAASAAQLPARAAA